MMIVTFGAYFFVLIRQVYRLTQGLILVLIFVLILLSLIRQGFFDVALDL